MFDIFPCKYIIYRVYVKIHCILGMAPNLKWKMSFSSRNTPVLNEIRLLFFLQIYAREFEGDGNIISKK